MYQDYNFNNPSDDKKKKVKDNKKNANPAIMVTCFLVVGILLICLIVALATKNKKEEEPTVEPTPTEVTPTKAPLPEEVVEEDLDQTSYQYDDDDFFKTIANVDRVDGDVPDYSYEHKDLDFGIEMEGFNYFNKYLIKTFSSSYKYLIPVPVLKNTTIEVSNSQNLGDNSYESYSQTNDNISLSYYIIHKPYTKSNVESLLNKKTTDIVEKNGYYGYTEYNSNLGKYVLIIIAPKVRLYDTIIDYGLRIKIEYGKENYGTVKKMLDEYQNLINFDFSSLLPNIPVTEDNTSVEE